MLTYADVIAKQEQEEGNYEVAHKMRMLAYAGVC